MTAQQLVNELISTNGTVRKSLDVLGTFMAAEHITDDMADTFLEARAILIDMEEA